MKKVLISLISLLITPLFAAIQVDGSLDEWNNSQRLNLPKNMPPSLADGTALYGTYEESTDSYKFAIQAEDTAITTNTTIWLNTDDDKSSGYKIWGEFSGAEYYINIHTDNQPYLYSTEPFASFVAGPLTHSYNVDGTVLEFSLDASLINNPTTNISMIADINDAIYLPEFYSLGEFTLSKEVLVLPKRTDFTKKIAIVFSEGSRNNFYDVGLPVQKAYNQLFMTMQYQAMMAGLPYDLLTEDDLMDVENIVNYDTIILPNFVYIPKEKFTAIKNTLYHAVYSYGIGIITAGDFLTNYADGTAVQGDSYQHMKQLLGISYGGGNGPLELTLNASETSHPVMTDYVKDEEIFKFQADLWYSTFNPVTNGEKTLDITQLAHQKVEGISEDLNAVLAIENNGRHVHFSTIEYLGNTNLLWSAIQWSVYGDKKPVSLKMGRLNNLFISRNDMDQSQESEEVKNVDGALLPLLKKWKRRFKFVGSYFINVGDNAPTQFTDWSYSSPLYQKYMTLGNEMGTHSYTHPHDTNELTQEEIEFEFNQSINIITEELSSTWRNQVVRGGAVPGAPEDRDTAKEIIQYLDYLTGGYSSVGSGYPGAIGYLTPTSDKVYFSPNMSFDFTMMEFGIPVYDKETREWTPQQLTAQQAQEHWANEYKFLMNHAKLPIIHWPWHDYGPTTSVKNENPYSVSMFENTIKLAYKDKSEFVTSVDAAQRIETFKNSKVNVTHVNDTTTEINIDSDNVGKFAIDMQVPSGQKIKSVTNWYAYNNNKVFLDKDGGNFKVQLGTRQDNVTRIIDLPMRAELLSLKGDGNTLSFTFKGEGKVKVRLKKNSSTYSFEGADRKRLRKRSAVLTFKNYGVHTVEIKVKTIPNLVQSTWTQTSTDIQNETASFFSNFWFFLTGSR